MAQIRPQADGEGSGALWARHLIMFFGLAAIMLVDRLSSGEGGRAIILMVFIDSPSALIFLYFIPLQLLTVALVATGVVVGDQVTKGRRATASTELRNRVLALDFADMAR